MYSWVIILYSGSLSNISLFCPYIFLLSSLEASSVGSYVPLTYSRHLQSFGVVLNTSLVSGTTRSWLLKPLKQPRLLGEMADFRTEPEKYVREAFNIL